MVLWSGPWSSSIYPVSFCNGTVSINLPPFNSIDDLNNKELTIRITYNGVYKNETTETVKVKAAIQTYEGQKSIVMISYFGTRKLSYIIQKIENDKMSGIYTLDVPYDKGTVILHKGQ